MKTIEHLSILHQSPLAFTSLFTSFFSHIDIHPNNVLLAYLVLPIKYSPELYRKFAPVSGRGGPTARSNLASVFGLYSATSNSEVLALPALVRQYKSLTSKILLTCYSADYLSIDHLSQVELGKRSKKVHENITNDDALFSRKLASLFNKYEIDVCFRELGVTKL